RIVDLDLVVHAREGDVDAARRVFGDLPDAAFGDRDRGDAALRDQVLDCRVRPRERVGGHGQIRVPAALLPRRQIADVDGAAGDALKLVGVTVLRPYPEDRVTELGGQVCEPAGRDGGHVDLLSLRRRGAGAAP